MDVTNFSDEESDNFYSGDEETSPPRKRIAIAKAVAVTVAAVMKSSVRTYRSAMLSHQVSLHFLKFQTLINSI